MDDVEFARWLPVALVFTHRDLSGRADGEAVRHAQPGGDDLGFRAIGRYFEEHALLGRGDVRQPRSGFAKIEIAGAVGLEVEVVVGGVGGEDGVVVEVLVEVGLAIAIEIAQPRDLVTAHHIDFTAHDAQTERLEEPAGEASPREFIEFVVDARHHPDLPLRGANRGATIGKEIETGKERVGLPRIFRGLGDAIHDIGRVVLGSLTLGDHRLRPQRRSTLRQLAQIVGHWRQSQGIIRRFLGFPQRSNVEPERLIRRHRREFQNHRPFARLPRRSGTTLASDEERLSAGRIAHDHAGLHGLQHRAGHIQRR